MPVESVLGVTHCGRYTIWHVHNQYLIVTTTSPLMWSSGDATIKICAASTPYPESSAEPCGTPIQFPIAVYYPFLSAITFNFPLSFGSVGFLLFWSSCLVGLCQRCHMGYIKCITFIDPRCCFLKMFSQSDVAFVKHIHIDYLYEWGLITSLMRLVIITRDTDIYPVVLEYHLRTLVFNILTLVLFVCCWILLHCIVWNWVKQ